MAQAPNSNIASLLAAANAKRPQAPAKTAPAPDASKIAWDNVSPDDLPPDVRDLYHAIGKARSAFEAAMTAMLEPPDHLRLVFAYKRGLAIGLAPRTAEGQGLAALLARISSAE